MFLLTQIKQKTQIKRKHLYTSVQSVYSVGKIPTTKDSKVF